MSTQGPIHYPMYLPSFSPPVNSTATCKNCNDCTRRAKCACCKHEQTQYNHASHRSGGASKPRKRIRRSEMPQAQLAALRIRDAERKRRQRREQKEAKRRNACSIEFLLNPEPWLLVNKPTRSAARFSFEIYLVSSFSSCWICTD